MKTMWWKILGVLLVLYTLIAGMVVPLKTGILHSSPATVDAGKTIDLAIEGYNSQYDKVSEVKAYLKFDSVKVLPAKSVTVNGRTQLSATFDLPTNFGTDKNIDEATLIVFNENDGFSIMPSALFVRKFKGEMGPVFNWPKHDLLELQDPKNFGFPFRSILYETIRNTFFHVAIWLSMMIILIASVYSSVQFLRTRKVVHDINSYSLTSIGILWGLIGIATGTIWAKFTWGAFWTSDIKLNMAAVSVLIYLAYWILRGSIDDVDKKRRLSAIYSIFAFVALVPLIWVIPRLTDSLHPGNGGNPALGGEDLDNTLRMVFYPAIIGLTLIGVWIAQLMKRTMLLEERYENNIE